MPESSPGAAGEPASTGEPPAIGEPPRTGHIVVCGELLVDRARAILARYGPGAVRLGSN